MLRSATTEREYPWGTLRSTKASMVKVVLEEKELPYQVNRLRPEMVFAFVRQGCLLLLLNAKL